MATLAKIQVVSLASDPNPASRYLQMKKLGDYLRKRVLRMEKLGGYLRMKLLSRRNCLK